MHKFCYLLTYLLIVAECVFVQGFGFPGGSGWTGFPGQPGPLGGRGWFQVYVFALSLRARRMDGHISFVAVIFCVPEY